MTHIGPSPGPAPESEMSTAQKAVIAALWGVVIILAGYVYSDSQSQRSAMASELQKVRADQQLSVERIAIQEESMRNVRESLKRIEEGVNTLNRERRR